MFNTGQELLTLCKDQNKSIADIMLEREMDLQGASKEEVITKINQVIDVMFKAVIDGVYNDQRSLGGLIGGDAKRILRAVGSKSLHYLPANSLKAVAYAMAVMEVNSLMGIIVAAPTAGSCGVLPAVLKYAQEQFEFKREVIVKGVLTASAVGHIVTTNATVSGAEGGCQAEIGTATAMSAAALVAMREGSPEQSLDAAAFSFKNILGLACDPIAGLVESPCTKRNAMGTLNAMLSADLALLGMASVIPFDEVVEAMYKVGRMMSSDLRETARGGIAACPSAKAIERRIFGDDSK